MITFILLIVFVLFQKKEITVPPAPREVKANIAFLHANYHVPVRIPQRKPLERVPLKEVIRKNSDLPYQYKMWKESLLEYERIREKLIS